MFTMGLERFTADQILDAIERLVDIWEAEGIDGRLPDEQWDILRMAALKRDHYTCQGCAKTDLPLDVHHIIPITKGGKNWLSNLISLCRSCHERVHPWLGVKYGFAVAARAIKALG